MTSRSIVLGTAALLLMSAATPLQIGFSPTAAYAQALTLEAAMAGNPSEFNAPQLRERIQLLRAAVQDGRLTGADRQAAQEKIRAYREVLDGIRAERQEARQDDGQAEQPRRGERTQRQPDSNANERATEQRGRQAEQQAQRQAQREAERQAQREAERHAQREAERQAQRDAERQAQRDAERQAQREAERQAQREAERQAQREAERQAQREAERQAERQAQREAERQAERQVERQAERQEGRRERRAERRPEPEEVNRRAREITSDNRPAADLDNQALRQRLNQNRELLGTDQLSRAQMQELRQQLRADREELRARVAARQEEQEDARAPDRGSDDRTRGSRDRTRGSDDRTRGSDDRNRGSDDRTRGSDDRMTDRNVSRIIEERTPSDQLTERELEQRVRVLSRALRAGNITVRQAEVARLLISRDREELRSRLHAERDRRRDRRRRGSRDHVVIEFEVGYRPPPVIYAAEAMPRDIQMQLVAPPRFQMQRAYSVQEIATNHDVREMMPGIEIDTLNFDFGSAEVRPEEIDKLDEIGIVIESIVAERPNEVFLIEGHTDAVGSDAANDALSQQRALAVREALLDYFIIDPENLQTVGLGERYLKIQTPEPEEENRRVTVRRITPLLAGRG